MNKIYLFVRVQPIQFKMPTLPLDRDQNKGALVCYKKYYIYLNKKIFSLCQKWVGKVED